MIKWVEFNSPLKTPVVRWWVPMQTTVCHTELASFEFSMTRLLLQSPMRTPGVSAGFQICFNNSLNTARRCKQVAQVQGFFFMFARGLGLRPAPSPLAPRPCSAWQGFKSSHGMVKKIASMKLAFFCPKEDLASGPPPCHLLLALARRGRVSSPSLVWP